MKKFKKLLSIMVVVVMCLTSAPISGFVGFEFKTEAVDYKVGDRILFGSYPQSKVTDSATISALNEKAPTWDNWNSYGYYSSYDYDDGIYTMGTMIKGDWMRYVDITYKGNKFRGVKFTQYRPYSTIFNSSVSNTHQDNNDYGTNTVYWFMFERIEWRVLDPDTGLVMCETIIDSQPYSNTIFYNSSERNSRYAYFNDVSYKSLASDYETSSIRKWLNDDFYNTAFTDNEKKEISTTTINNEGFFTSLGASGYERLDSNETNDKIFLLSHNEVKNSKFGFNSSITYIDTARRGRGSDYAYSQGLVGSFWLLRTAADCSNKCCRIDGDGISGYTDVDYTYNGVRPALRFNNVSTIYKSVSIKYNEGENPKHPTFFITPLALDGGWGKGNIVSNGTAITNIGENEYSSKIVIGRSELTNEGGPANGAITIKVAGYRDCIIPNKVLKNVKPNYNFSNYYATTAYMQLERNNDPYISTVYARNGFAGEYSDIRASQNKIHCTYFDTQDIIVSVGGLSDGETISKVVLLQSDEEKFESPDGCFRNINLASKFEENKEIFVYAITSEGKETAREKVHIEIEFNNQIGDGLTNMLSMDLLGADGQSIGLDTNIPFLKDAKVSLDALKIPVGVSKDGDVYRISFGVDICTYEKENEGGIITEAKWDDFKEQVDKHFQWLGDPDDDDPKSFEDAIDKFNDVKKTFGDKKEVDEYIKSKKKAALDFNVGALGYIEGSFCNGKWRTTAWNGGLLVNFKVEKSTPISILGFPCYWGIGGGADGRASYMGSREVASKDVPMETTWLFEITPMIIGKFGAGVDSLLYAGLVGEGFVPVNFVTADKYLKIEFGAKLSWEAGVWILTADGVIWDHDPVTIVEKYFNDNASRVVRSFAVDYAAKTTPSNTEQKAQVLSRDYAETTSEWLYGEPDISIFALRDYVQQGVTFTDLQQSVFADSKLQMVQVGDDTFATWIEDDTSRDTYNRMRLVYSVRDGYTGLWSEPKAVWDTGVNDGYPSVATDGEKVYITWQKVNKVIKESDCIDAAVFYNNGEICLAEYDINNDKVTSTKFITNNNYYDYSPVVIVNDEPVVFWTSSKDNNMTAMDGCNFNRHSDGTTTTLLEDISSPITVSAEVIDGKENISYCTDTDGNFETTDDITVNTYIDGTVTTFDKGENSLAIKDAKYGKLNGESVLFMQDGTNIFYEEDGEIVNVFDVDGNIDGNFSIVEAVNGTQLIWTEKDENGSSNIFSCVYSDNVWSDPVKVSENDKYITNLVAVCANGKIIGGCNRTEVFYDEETQEVTRGFTDLSCWSMEDFSDISIELFSYREKDFIESGSKSFDLHISNNGTTNIDEIEFVIEDALGNNTTVTKEVNLISGDAQTVEVPYIPAENYSATTLTVTAIIPDDIDEEDNVISFDVGSSDVAIEVGDVIEQEDCFDISTLISNISLIDAENVKLSIYANSEESEAIETFDIGNMTASSISDARISIREEAVDFSEAGVGVIYLKLTANDESNTNNNAVCVPLIIEKEKECGHPLTETVSGKAPTCIEDGTSDYEVCIVCGKNATESEVVPAKHSFGEWYIITPATCKETGLKQRDCLVCNNASETESVPIVDTNHSFDEWYLVEEATCQKTGMSQRDCIDCDYYETESIPVSDHDYILASTSTTCLEDGYETYICSYDCGETYTEFHSAYGHNYFWTWFEEIPATCSEDGLKWTFCLRCREIKEQIIPKLEHEDNDGDGACDKCGYNDDAPDIPEHSHSYNVSVTLAPSCETKGIKKFSCDCGDTYTEEIAALGHKEVIDESVESSCSGFGLTEGRHCELCGKVIIKQDVIAKKDHNFDGSKCKNCDYDKAEYCSCNCHKGGIAGFFFKLILFFQKIFKQNEYCSGCGIAHY